MAAVELSDILTRDDRNESTGAVDVPQATATRPASAVRAAFATLLALLLLVLVLTIVLATTTASLDECQAILAADNATSAGRGTPVPMGPPSPPPTLPSPPGSETGEGVPAATDVPSESLANASVTSVILLVADGMGVATTGMVRTMLAMQAEREARGMEPPDWSAVAAVVRNGSRVASLPLDNLLVGTSRTYSANSWVTDSAAAATAYSCAIKTHNARVAVDGDGRSCRTVLEALKEDRGFATGLVATSRLTHATPAAFAAHVANRGDEAAIATDMTRPGLLDVAFGGGLGYLTPSLIADRRPDAAFVTTPAQLAATTTTPVFGLFGSGHLDYELDRTEDAQPSLTTMATKAMSLLQARVDDGSVPGFFLLVEGSRIDHAGHRNDAAAHVGEAIEYSRTVAAVVAHAEAHPGTLVVAVSDHETGGMTLGRDGTYAWYPEVLLQVHASADVTGARLGSTFTPTDNATDAEENDALRAAIAPYLSFSLSESEASSLRASLAAGQGGTAVRNLVNARARIGWTSGGHTGVDVPVHAFGGGDTFRGSMEDIEIGRRMAQLVGVSLPQIKQE